MKIRLTILLVIVILAASLWSKYTFTELPLQKTTPDSISIFSWGIGKSFNENLAKDKAKNNAMMLLSQQVNGQKFSYTSSNGTVTFTTSTAGKFTDVKEHALLPLSPREKMIIISARTLSPSFDPATTVRYRVKAQSTELSETLNQLSKVAVEKLLTERYPGTSQLTGTIYFVDMNVTMKETTKTFSLTMDVIIEVK